MDYSFQNLNPQPLTAETQMPKTERPSSESISQQKKANQITDFQNILHKILWKSKPRWLKPPLLEKLPTQLLSTTRKHFQQSNFPTFQSIHWKKDQILPRERSPNIAAILKFCRFFTDSSNSPHNFHLQMLLSSILCYLPHRLWFPHISSTSVLQTKSRKRKHTQPNTQTPKQKAKGDADIDEERER